MKLKTDFKILLVFGIMLGVILFLGTTKVEAKTGIITEGNITENCLDDILDTITLDMKTTKLENLLNIIFDKVVNELKNQGVTVIKGGEIDNNCIWIGVVLDPPPIALNEKDTIEDAHIMVIENKLNEGKQRTIAEKKIKINWNNKSSYSENDKKYVENLINNINLPKNTNGNYNYTKYVELGKDPGSRVNDIIDVLKKEVNDSSIEFIPNGMGSGGGDLFSGGGEIGLSIFKDGIYYMNIHPASNFQYQITVPSNVGNTDTDYINYSIPKIKSYLDTYYNEEYKGTVTLEKISGYWYKVNGNYEDNIIIKKQEGTPIGNNIFVNNLPLNVNVTVTSKENNTMEAEIKNKGYSKILGSYELTLTGTDKLESPIDITFNVGTENNGKTIYILHQKKNGTYENFEKKVTDGKVAVTVSELSPFVLGIKEENKKPVETTPPTETPIETPTQTVDKGEKDETPKTGTVDIIGYVGLITLVSLVGIVELKKRLK